MGCKLTLGTLSIVVCVTDQSQHVIFVEVYLVQNRKIRDSAGRARASRARLVRAVDFQVGTGTWSQPVGCNVS